MSRRILGLFPYVCLIATSPHATAEGTPQALAKQAHDNESAQHSHDFARRPLIGSPSLSPDGQHMAVVVRADEDGESQYQLAVLHIPDLTYVSRVEMPRRCLPIDVTWTDNRRLVMGIGKESAFSEPVPATGDIVAIDRDGKNRKTLVTSHPRISPEAASSFLKVPRGFASITGSPSPTNGHFYLTINPPPESANSGAQARRTFLYDVDAVTGNAKEMASVDGDSYRFLVHDGVARYAYGLDKVLREHVYYRGSSTEDWREIGENIVGKYFVPLFMSSDGKTLYSIGNPAGGTNVLATSAADGSDLQTLVSNPRGDINAVYRSPAPRIPYAAIAYEGKPKIYYLDDSKYARALKALNATYPDHFVTFSDLSSAGGTGVVYAVSDRDPGTYALYDFQKNTLTPLFQSMPWVKQETLGERQPFWFKGTSGTELGGFINFPSSGKRNNLPTVLMPHGGPNDIANTWAIGNWEENEAQFLAGLGFLVVQVNFRGSAGRGKNFADAAKRQVGSGLLQDQLDALNWAIANGYADAAKVCVYGADYGGYAAYQLPGFSPPDTFKCAIAFAAISDIRSLKAERYSRRDEEAIEDIWGTRDASFAKANSPINNLDKLRVPVLIVHGRDDVLVPVRSTQQMTSALEKASKPFQQLIVAGEGHGFTSERNNSDRYEAMDTFLRKNLVSTGLTREH